MSGRDMTPHQKNNTILFTGSPKQALIILSLDGTYGTVNCHSNESLTSKGKFHYHNFFTKEMRTKYAMQVKYWEQAGGFVKKTLLQSSSFIRFERSRFESTADNQSTWLPFHGKTFDWMKTHCSTLVQKNRCQLGLWTSTFRPSCSLALHR